LISAAVMTVVAAAVAAPPAMAEPKKANIAFVVVEEDPLAQAMFLMAEYMERSAPQSFDIEVHPASTLFTQSQQIPAMTRGNLEIGYVNFFDIAAQIPKASILTAGYLLRDVEHQCAVLNSEFGRDMLAEVEEKMGIKIIGQALIGYRTLVLRKKQEVNTPEDIADLTMREVGNEAFQFLAEALGAKPTPIAYSELYLALQTGTVDAFAGFATAMENTKFHEVSEQFVLTNHLLAADLIGVSLKFWDMLSDDEKAVVQEAAQVASMFATNTRKRLDAKALDRLRELGLEVTTPDVGAFRAHMTEKYLGSKFAEAWPDGLWQEIEALPSELGCVIN
jgi:TRAP-type C4-dicarboxylate transport system substrate-binding protein